MTPISEIRTRVRSIDSCRILFYAISASFVFVIPQNSFAQSWDRDTAGTFIYQRDVPTQPAQVVGEPAPPDKIILSGPDSPFDAVMGVGSALTDMEAGAISAQLPNALGIVMPATPGSDTDPKAMVGFAETLASNVVNATQGTVAATVNQTTALLGSVTSTITNALGKLPMPGGL